MTRQNRKFNRKRCFNPWKLISILAILALVLGALVIIRPGNYRQAEAPRITKKVKRHRQAEDKTKKAVNNDQKNERLAGTNESTIPSASESVNEEQVETPTPTNPVVPNEENQPSSYDSVQDAVNGTEIGGELNNLVAELNKLAAQYEEFKDLSAFQQGLNNIQSRNNQLLARAQTSADRNLANKLNGAISRMQADPENAQSIIAHIWH